jgi:hypothetical protein
MYIGKIDAGQLGKTHAAVQEKRQYAVVPFAASVFGFRGRDRSPTFFKCQIVGKTSFQFRRIKLIRRIFGNQLSFLAKVPKK